ncbi:MAG: thioredoxin domain-containing protein [Planctomycetota bacterium]|nr:thioredoxin domain-containing protein [Planctomycetota bacterium]
MSNRLADATSPYLLQHKDNPVDWYPWGEAAFARARAEKKPIFLSIGYSACHWCHVMERESFEDAELAQLLNDHFVSIKVDREQRPDLDQIYMQAVQSLTGRGGWPMSVFLNNEGEPFFGGTYWPPHPRQGMPGFNQVLHAVSDAWQNQHDKIAEQAARLTASLAIDRTSAPENLDPLTILEAATAALEQAYDANHGGFGGPPKFPHPLEIRLCLRLARWHGRENLMHMASHSLDQMAAGGLYDQLGGGFHRYAVDAHWLVPHFEKMLYDNALLAGCYLEAFLATGQNRYREIVIETLDYTLREMQHPDGGFYSTQDADSEGVEGKFFVWSIDEINETLDRDSADLVCAFYNVTADGNFEGQNILHQTQSLEAFAASQGRDQAECKQQLDKARQKLFAVRQQRICPALDDKILADWNGLLIDTLARAGAVLEMPQYLDAARRASHMIDTKMRDLSGRLMHSWREGVAEGMAFVDDYAALLGAWITLYECTFEEVWVDRAVGLADALQQRFEDSEQGGFFFTADDHERLIVRRKEFFDQATPNGNALAAEGLLRLADLLGRDDFRQSAQRALEVAGDTIRQAPLAQGQSVLALMRQATAVRQWVMVGSEPSSETQEILHDLRQAYLPYHVLACRLDDSMSASSDALDHLFLDRPVGGTSWELHYCEGYTCLAPAGTLAAAKTLIKKAAES